MLFVFFADACPESLVVWHFSLFVHRLIYISKQRGIYARRIELASRRLCSSCGHLLVVTKAFPWQHCLHSYVGLLEIFDGNPDKRRGNAAAIYARVRNYTLIVALVDM